jgi:hypothetical protein
MLSVDAPSRPGDHVALVGASAVVATPKLCQRVHLARAVSTLLQVLVGLAVASEVALEVEAVAPEVGEASAVIVGLVDTGQVSDTKVAVTDLAVKPPPMLLQALVVDEAVDSVVVQKVTDVAAAVDLIGIREGQLAATMNR